MTMEQVSWTRMKILVIGATSPMGISIISEALTRGYEVIALVRNPEKMISLTPRLQVVEADFFNPDDIAEHLDGCKAVLSGIEAWPRLTPCTIYAKSCEAVVKAMRQKDIKRLMVITFLAIEKDPLLPSWLTWAMNKLLFLRKHIYEDMAICERYLDYQCRDIQFTVVKLFDFTNQPSEGIQILASESQSPLDMDNRIGRQDLAKFMLNNLAQKEYYRKFIYVRYSR
ncbi:flavin reductase (NADPH) [Biomphalaria glabrata]|nr:flavin reductase (NADPH) [Biomphalaria glabrata]